MWERVKKKSLQTKFDHNASQFVGKNPAIFVLFKMIKTLFIEAAHLDLPSLPCGPLENLH